MQTTEYVACVFAQIKIIGRSVGNAGSQHGVHTCTSKDDSMRGRQQARNRSTEAAPVGLIYATYRSTTPIGTAPASTVVDTTLQYNSRSTTALADANLVANLVAKHG